MPGVWHRRRSRQVCAIAQRPIVLVAPEPSLLNSITHGNLQVSSDGQQLELHFPTGGAKLDETFRAELSEKDPLLFHDVTETKSAPVQKSLFFLSPGSTPPIGRHRVPPT